MKAFNKHIFAFLGPTVICLSLGLILPLLSLFIMSFTNLELGFSQESFSFIGLTNYSNLIHNESTWKSISVTILFVLITVSIETVIGLILALFMATKFKGQFFIKALLVLPMMIAPIVVGLVWRYLFDNRFIESKFSSIFIFFDS